MERHAAASVFRDCSPAASAAAWTTSPFARSFDGYFFLDITDWFSDSWRTSQFLGWFNNVGDRQALGTSARTGTVVLEMLQPSYAEFRAWLDAMPADPATAAWCGPTDRWGLVTDAATGVGLLGVDRSVESHVDSFFSDVTLSPADAAARLGIDPTLLETEYAPSRYLIEPSAENPEWIKFHFACHVTDEDDKLFYWPQFEPLHAAFMEALAGFPYVRMLPSQALWRAVRNRQGEMLRITGVNAPVGGWQAFTHANCKKVATKFLSNNRQLQLRFEGRNDEADALYPTDRTGLPGFQFWWLRASRTPRKSPEEGADLYVVCPGGDGTREQRINQHFTLQVLTEAIDAHRLERLVERLREIGHAEEVYRTRRPARQWEVDSDGRPRTSGIYAVGPDVLHPDGSIEFHYGSWELV
jgi:hypothetical protein